MNKYDIVTIQDAFSIPNKIKASFPIGSTSYDVNGTSFYESEFTFEDNTKGSPVIALESLKTRLGTSLVYELNKALENFGDYRRQFVDSHLIEIPVIGGILSLCYGNGKYIATGGSGKMAYSTDGINWTAVSDSPFGSSYIYSICYGNGKYVAGDYYGKIAYSTDGINWTKVSNSTFSSYIFSICYGNGKYIAGGASGKMAYSTDGITWTAVSDSTFGTNPISSICYGNGKFVTVGDAGKMAYCQVGVPE